MTIDIVLWKQGYIELNAMWWQAYYWMTESICPGKTFLHENSAFKLNLGLIIVLIIISTAFDAV